MQSLVENDLAVLLSERFELTGPHEDAAAGVPLAGTLPVPATPLVGREQDAAAVEALADREGVRLVTLTGPGGVGKSRLAVEVADRLWASFADGARFVDLSSVRAAELVAAVIATGLGLSTSGARLIGDVKSYLRGRRLLLVLDNFEQVTEAAPLVADLLGAAPAVVALVTSRTVLRIRGEHEFAVPTLPVPQATAGGDTAGLLQYASVGLFVERARAAAPGFELTSQNAEAVAEICRRLDGLPLAIELAAARVKLLAPQALLSRLGHRFSVLTGGARDLPERQRTLRSTLDWSFGLLSAGEQALFARLGVFAGTFSLSAVETVGGEADDIPLADPDHAGQLIDTLGSLVDNSLVQAETRSAEPRFRLLETVREYALELLREGAEWRQAHDRHAAYFLALAEPTAAELQGRGQLGWLGRLETEHDNLWAAMSWLVDQDQLEPAADVFWVTWRFWWLHGHPAELAGLGEKIAAGSERLPPYQRAMALTAAGFMFMANGDQARAQTLFEQTLPLYPQVREKRAVALKATVLSVLGHLSALRHDFAGAGELLDQSQAALREVGQDELSTYERLQYLLTAALASNYLGQIRLSQRNHDEAAQLFTEGLSAARRAQDRITKLVSLYDLALSSQARGDLDGAAGLLKEGLSLAAEAGDDTSAAYYLEALAAVAGQRDDSQRAVRLLAAARSLLETKGSGWLHAYVPREPPGDADLAAWRSRLGEEDFDEARAWGRSAGTSRAVEYALK